MSRNRLARNARDARPHAASFFHPRLEQLETRLVPTTHTWDGSFSQFWSDDANWQENSAPAAGETNLVLIFPSGMPTDSRNDINGLSITSITFSGDGYQITSQNQGHGKSITVTGGITVQSGVTTTSIDLNMTLGAAQTFTVASGAEIDLGGVISGVATAGLTKAGAGTLVLSGTSNNTFAGSMTVSEGTLELSKTAGKTAIPAALIIGDGTGSDTVLLDAANQIDNQAAITITQSGLLNLNNNDETIGPLTVTAGSAAAVTTGAGTLTLNGNVTVNASTDTALITGKLELGLSPVLFSVADGTADPDLQIDAVITGNGALSKTGAGSLWLTATNDYTGVTTVAAGVLRIQGNGRLGTGAAGTTVQDGATLQLDNLAVSNADALTLSGKGVGDAGALQVISGSPTLTTAITLAATGANANAFIGVPSGSLTLSGVVSGTGGLAKVGDGTLILSGTAANTYAGTTQVNQGTLQLQKSAGVAAVPHALVVGDAVGTDTAILAANHQIADTSAVSVLGSGVLDLNGLADTIGSLSLSGGVVQTGVGTLALAGNVSTLASATQASISGNLDLGAASRTFTVADGAATTDLLIDAVISNGALVKAGAGKLVLQGVNTYAGLTRVAAGILDVQNAAALGSTAVGTVVADGATLQLEASVAGEALTLSGKGQASIGALDNVSGTNTWSGPVVLTKTTPNPNVFLGAEGGTLTLSGVVSGTAGLTKVGTGTIVLGGSSANTYAGITRVNAGLLSLDKSSGLAIPHALIVGDGVGGANSDELRLLQNEQILNAAAVTVMSSGFVNLNGLTETLSALTLTGGTVGGGTLVLGGSVKTLASASTSTISGNLDLGGVARTFTVANGAAATDLLIDAVISNGAFNKAGPGKLVLSGINTFSGAVRVNAGILSVQNDQALGNTTGNTTVASGAILQIEGGTYAEALTLLGAARLESVSGVNTWSGNVTMTALSKLPNATMSVLAGTLDLSGVVQGTAGLTKTGAGELHLSGASANTYRGITRVNAGKLVLGKTAGVNAIPGNLIIGDGLGGSLADIVEWLASDQVANKATLTLTKSGLVDMNGFAETLHAIVFKGGSLTDVGSLTIV